jgi:hypothetical protein
MKERLDQVGDLFESLLDNTIRSANTKSLKELATLNLSK